MKKLSPTTLKSQSDSRKLSTSQQLKSTGVPCLKRHTVTHEYYAVKKVNGTIRTQKLLTQNDCGVTDRKLAERLLKDWIDKITAPPARHETLGHLVEYRLANEISALSKSRQKNFKWFVNCLESEFPFLKDIEVQKITPAVIEEILPKIKQRNGKPYKPRSYNELVGQIKSLIEIAIRREIISRNPFLAIPRNKKRKTVKDSPTETPSFEQFWLIVEQIRKNRFTDHSEESANFVAFMGCAGLGAAEVRNIKWSDIEYEFKRIQIQRVKTDEYFTIPIYPELEQVIALMDHHAIKDSTELLFKIKSVPKKALATACASLGYPNFTPRSLRKMRITDLLRKNIHYKTVAKWQGHQDGGILILKTYSNIMSESNESFESVQVAKLYDQHKQEQSEQ